MKSNATLQLAGIFARSFLARFFACMILVTAALAVDVNKDGMDDLWQARYNIAAFAGSGDPDGDGRINFAEAMNMTDPLNTPNPGLGMIHITDTNPADGLDDHWQTRFGISGADKLLDPDGDGRSNLEESYVGSDPFVVDEPWSNAGSTQGGGAAAGPQEYILTMPWTVPGWRYTLQSSDTLMREEWSTAAVASGQNVSQWGTGGSISVTATTGGAERKFFRWLVDSPDSDGDTLGDWNELQLGSNLYSDDTDNDGFADGVEWLSGFNLLSFLENPAASGHGVKVELSDVYFGAKHVVSRPNASLQKWLLRKTYYGMPGLSSPEDELLDVKPPFPTLPDVPERTALTFGDWDLFDFTGDRIASTAERGTWSVTDLEERWYDVRWARVRAVSDYTSTRARVVYLLLETLSQDLTNGSPTGEKEVADSSFVAVQLPAGAAQGPALDIPLAVEQDKTQEVKATKVTPQVRGYSWYWQSLADDAGGKPQAFRKLTASTSDPTGYPSNSTNLVKVAGWDNGVLEQGNPFQNNFHPENIKHDPDAFYVRVSGASTAPGAPSVFVRISTDSPGTEYDDTGAVVELSAVAGSPGVFQSQALCVVSNTADDTQPSPGADGQAGDATFKVALDGVVQMQMLENGAPVGDKQTVATVKPQRVLPVKAYILRKGAGGTGAAAVSEDTVLDYLKTAQERFAQVGIRLDASVVTVNANPAGVEFGDNQDFNNPSLPSGVEFYTLPPETKSLFTLNQPNVVECYFVSDFANPGTLAYAVVPRALAQADVAHAYQVVLNASTIAADTLAHELLHVVLNGIHGPPQRDFLGDADKVRSLWYSGQLGAPAIFYRTRISDAIYYNLYACPLLKVVP